MRALVQRVDWARVFVDGHVVGQVENGMLVLLGVGQTSTKEQAERLVNKLIALRIFQDEAGKPNLSLQQVGGGVMVVSQFTLYADIRRGNRPSYTLAAPPEPARALYELVLQLLERQLPGKVAAGQFGASMHVELRNSGPYTLWLEADSDF